MARFGRFELQPERRLLLQDGQAVPIGARAFDLLVALSHRRDRIVSKAELLDLVWPDVVVEENNLQVQVSSLRRLLGPQAIGTIPGRGYRFTAAIEGAANGDTGALAPTPTRSANPTAVAAPPLTNLPSELPLLYGREADLTALVELVRSRKLVTVVGAGGMGKSRLAQAAAHAVLTHWPDGVWMVELAGLADPALLPNVVAQALRISVTGQAAALDELAAALARRHLLIVIDNCEHLLDAAATLVQTVMNVAPGVTVLATSQEPLHLSEEQQYRMKPLAVPGEAITADAREFGALALFEARVRAVNPHFSLDEDSLDAAVDICRRLDGLPLAIELAAARVATLGLSAVHDKLGARFKLLTGGKRATLPRHQTLRAALAWSHQLLNAAEQLVFCRLAVFAGGFTMELAQAVAGDADLDEWSVLDILSALVDKSLVVADTGDVPRYRLLESARAFALEQLPAIDKPEVLRRHAAAVRALLERIDGPNLDGEMRTDQLRALLIPEQDNVRAARAWAIGEGDDLETAVVLASCTSALEDFAFEATEWLVPLRQGVEAGATSPAVAARYWRALTSANVSMTGRVPRAIQRDAAQRASALYRQLGQLRRAFSSLTQLGIHRMVLADREGAQAAADEARELLQPDWPAMLRIRLLRFDGYLAREAGRSVDALALYREALEVSVSTGDWLLEVIARDNLIDLAWQIGPIEDAARDAMALVHELRDKPLTPLDMASPYVVLMGILSEMGRIDEATTMAREAMPLMLRAEFKYLEGWAHLFWRRGQLDISALLLGASDALCAATGEVLRPNEQRLIDAVRPALQTSMAPDALASAAAAGASLDDRAIRARVAQALAQPVASS